MHNNPRNLCIPEKGKYKEIASLLLLFGFRVKGFFLSAGSRILCDRHPALPRQAGVGDQQEGGRRRDGGLSQVREQGFLLRIDILCGEELVELARKSELLKLVH